MIKFPHDEVVSVCQKYGSLISVASPLDGVKIMKAIAMSESTMGFDCGPRYESAYDNHGVYSRNAAQASLLRQFGRDAACSYGPWQMMLVNCGGYTPTQMNTNLDDCGLAFLSHFNSYVVRGWDASTIQEIGQVWNGGHIFRLTEPSERIKRYCEDLQRNYEAA